MKKMIFVLIISLAMLLAMPVTVSAASGITEIDEFENLTEGDGQYIKYSDNYYLDRVDPGMFDKWSNGFSDAASNLFFGIFKEVSYLCMVVFYHCFAFDISEVMGDELDEIQSALRAVLFDGGIFLIVFSATAFYIINQLLRGDIQGLLNEILKVLVILILSMAVTTQSDTFLHFVNMTTKQIAVEALGGISGQALSSDDGNESMKRYAADVSGALWSGLVHKPWVALEFGDEYTGIEDDINKILRLKKSSKDREELIKNLNGGDKTEGPFNEAVGWNRIFPAFIMLIPIILKGVFYLIIAALQLMFQFFTLFFIIFCPVVLLLAISPQLGGTELIWLWLKKIIETQLSILILTFVIGLIVKFDALLANWSDAGWLIGLWIQVIVMIAFILNWKKVLTVMNHATRSIQNPQLALAMRQMRRGGGMAVNTITGATYGAQQLGNLANTAGLGALGMAGHAGAALSGAMSGAWDGLAENYTSKSNYNSVPQYSPRASSTAAPTSPAAASAAPNAPASKTGAPASAAAAAYQSNVVDYNKIPRYKSTGSASAPVPQTANQKTAVNNANSTGTNINSTAAAEKPYAVNYSAKTAHYTATNKTPPEAAQRPRTVENARTASKDTPQLKTPPRSPQAAVNERPVSGSQGQSVTSRNASVLNNTHQFIPKPVVQNFEFKQQAAPQKTTSISNPAKLPPKAAPVPAAKPKPVVEQFNFKVHAQK